MSEAMDTELRERLIAVPAEPPAEWSADLRARLSTAWEAEDIDTDSNAVTVVSLATERHRRTRRLWLVAAATAVAAAAAAVAVFSVGDSKNVVETDVPPVGDDSSPATDVGPLLPSNGPLVVGDGSGAPQFVDGAGQALTSIRCDDPCAEGIDLLWQIANPDRWSPDHKQVAYGANYGLYVIDVESGTTRRIAGPCAGTDPLSFTMWDGTPTNPPGPGNPSWSPDGTRIMYECLGLHIVNLADDQDVLIADTCELSLGCSDAHAGDYYYISGQWSPDGRSIAVTLEDPPAHTSSLHIVDATTGSHRVAAAKGTAVGWGPDGRLVYWVGDRGPLTYVGDVMTYVRTDDELRSIDSNGNDTLIARAPHGDVAPDFAHIAYITDYHEGAAEGADVRVRELVSGADVLIKSGEPREHRYEGLAWSPDGTRLAVSSDEGVEIVDPDGSHRVALPEAEGGALAWLPPPT
jgi:dipeptidyl aminopeptidase/acylaminoacyl peptidase